MCELPFSNIIHHSSCSGDVYRSGELHLIKNNLRQYFSDTGGPKDTDLVIPIAATAREMLLEVLYMFNVLHFVPLDEAVQYNIRRYLQQLKDFTETKFCQVWKNSSIARSLLACFATLLPPHDEDPPPGSDPAMYQATTEEEEEEAEAGSSKAKAKAKPKAKAKAKADQDEEEEADEVEEGSSKAKAKAAPKKAKEKPPKPIKAKQVKAGKCFGL